MIKLAGKNVLTVGQFARCPALIVYYCHLISTVEAKFVFFDSLIISCWVCPAFKNLTNM